MKKIAVLILVCSLLTSLAGCSSGNEDKPEGTPDNGTSSATAAPAESDNESGEGTKAPEEGEESSVKKIAQAIKDAYGENYLPDMEVPKELVDTTFGLEKDSYTDVFAETPMISAHPDTLIVVKAVNGKTGDVKAKLEKYRDYLVNESLQYPGNIAKVNASQVVANGDYAAFILLGAINENEDASEEEQKKFAEEQTKIGVDAFKGYFD